MTPLPHVYYLLKLMLLDCPFAHGLLDPFGICKKLRLQILQPSVLVYLRATPVLRENISLLMPSEKKSTGLSSMHLAVSNSLPDRNYQPPI